MATETQTLMFLGGAGTVTGSKYLLTINDRRILVDGGMFQGDKDLREMNWAEFPIDPASISDVLLTHAHMDHCGYLPRLVKHGFRGPIWCTEGTAKLADIVLRDAGFLQEKDAEYAARRGYSKHEPPEPLYDLDDVERTLPLLRIIKFDTDIDLGDGITAHYTRAGHILGSASILVKNDDWSIQFSGDLGRKTHPVLRAREIPEGAPITLIESTYGDREHPEPEGLDHEEFADAIRRTVARGGSVLVPAFAVDRTEVLLKTLGEMRRDKRIPNVPIFVNSPMGIKALQVYYDAEARDELREDLLDRDFIDLEHVTEVVSTEDSIKLNNPKVPCIIISSSGMATGGRVVHHLEHMLPDHRNTVVFTGYQAHGTRGRDLIEGKSEIKMHGRYIPVRAEVLMDDQFSVHADSSELVDWLRELPTKPQIVFLVHGEEDATDALSKRIRDELDIMAVAPKLGEIVQLRPSVRRPAAVVDEGVDVEQIDNVEPGLDGDEVEQD